MSAAVEVQPTRKAGPLIPIGLLLTVTFLVFCPSLGSSFHLDDVTLFSDPTVTAPSGGRYVWRPLQTRPLTYFTFWLNYQLGGQNAIGYHAVNVFLHLLAVWLLYGLCRRIAGVKAAFIAAVLFALHPIQTEPVAYIFERATLLATVFCLLTAYAWLDGDYPRAIGLFVLALLSKEECVAFPFFLLLIRAAILPAITMLCLSLAAGIRVLLAVDLLKVSGAGSRAGITPLDYLSTQGFVILRYFRLLLVPFGFTCDPDIPIRRDWQAWLAWAAVIGVVAIVWRFHPNGKWFAAGLILLAPSSSIFPAEDLAADRRMYLPLIALCLFAGLVLQHVRRTSILVPVAAGLAVVTAMRVQVWRSEQTLWAEAVERGPRKLRPRVLLARVSEPEVALRLLEEAQALAPNDPRPLIEKGVRLMALKQTEPALRELEHALAIAPEDPTVLNNYGVALSMAGRNAAAIEQFRHALRVDPCSATSRTNLLRLGVSASGPCR